MNSNKNVKDQTLLSANASQAEESPTKSAGSAQRRLPDKRFVWGAAAALIAVGFMIWYFNSGKKQENAPVSNVPSIEQQPSESYPEGPAYDPSLPSEEVTSTSATYEEEEVASVEVTTEDGQKEKFITEKSGSDNVGGIGYTNYNQFKQKDIPQGPTRFIMGDEAVLTVIYFADRPCPIYAGSQFFYDVCNGSLRLPSDKDPSLTRAAYGMRTVGKEVQFYHFPLCLISKANWDKILTAIKTANEEDPNRIISINVPFSQTNGDIQKMAADRLNEIYGLKGENAIQPHQITTPPCNSFDVFIGSDTEPVYHGGNGETVGFTISGKACDLKNKFFPIIKYQSEGIPFKVVYNIDGEISQRNLQQETIERVMNLRNIYNYSKDLKLEFSSIDSIHAGGGSVTVNVGIFSGTFKEGDKATYSKSELTGFVEASELKHFYLSQQTKIKRYYDFQFGNDPTPVTQVPEWKELFPNMISYVIPLKEDGTPDISPDDKDKTEKEKLFNDYWDAIKSKLSNSPEAIETLKKLLPGEDIVEDGTGIIKIRAERFFGLDIVKRKFRDGIKIYKLNEAEIEQGLSFLSLGIKHIYGSYPVTASSILFYGKTSQILQQGYYTIPLGGNTGFPVGAHGIIDGQVPTNGHFYFVTGASKINRKDTTTDDFCLGTQNAGTRFSINVYPSYDKETKIISIILECVIEPDQHGSSCKGKYVLRQKISGSEPVDIAHPEILFPDTVQPGTVLSEPKNKFVSDQNMFASYDDTYKYLKLSKVLESRSIPGHENGYNHMRHGEKNRDGSGKEFLTGYHSGDLPQWYYEQVKINQPFNMGNIMFNSREKDANGILQPEFINKYLLLDENGNPIINNPCFLFEGEHHNAYTNDTRNWWHKIWGFVHFARRYSCQTYNNVEFRILSGNKLQVPFTYVVRPAEMEYTVVGSIGGGTHFFLNSETNHWECMTEEKYNERLMEVKNNLSK